MDTTKGGLPPTVDGIAVDYDYKMNFILIAVKSADFDHQNFQYFMKAVFGHV